MKLSGGQKQRLSIARMFLKNPPILILDEATSSLDNKSEAVIQESISELAKDRTTFVIAHRMATIRNAQRIIVLTEKGIEEEGNHAEAHEAAWRILQACITLSSNLPRLYSQVSCKGENEMKLLIEMFISFFKIGAFTIGGGYAMLPPDSEGSGEEEEVDRRRGFSRYGGGGAVCTRTTGCEHQRFHRI